MKTIKHIRLKSSSLIETIVAMLISSIVFTMAFTIVINIASSSYMIKNAFYKITAHSRLESLKLNYVSMEGENTVEYDDYSLKEIVSTCSGSNDLVLLEVFVFDSKGILNAKVQCYCRK